MAHPLFVAEQAVRHFIIQWLSGSQPLLQLSTKPDGSIHVTSEVDTVPVPVQMKPKSIRPTSHRRSGHFARLRRRENRMARKVPADSHASSLQSQIDVTSSTDCSTMTSPVKPKLTTSKIISCDLSPEESSHLSRPKLSITTQPSLSIPPRIIYHPTVVNACYAILGKHPSSLTPEEAQQFKKYKEFKAKNNDPIEKNVVYLPIGGIRTCMHCEQPT